MAAPRNTMYIALDSFSYDDENGTPQSVIRGLTRVREGHPVLKGREALFAPIEPHLEAGAPGRSGEIRG